MTYPPYQPAPTTPPPTRKRIPNWLKIVVVLAAVVVVLCGVGGLVAIVQGVNAAGTGTYHPPVVRPSTAGAGAPAADKDPPADTPRGPRKAAVGETLQWDDAIGNSGTVAVNAVKVAGANVLITVDYLCATGSCDYNMFDWTYLDRSGTPHNQSYAGDVKGELHSGTLGAGQKVHGIVAFERGTDDTHGAQIQYSSGLETLAYFVVA
jgi:hypothetical protein